MTMSTDNIVPAPTPLPWTRDDLLRFHEAISDEVNLNVGPAMYRFEVAEARESFGVMSAEQYLLGEITDRVREMGSETRDRGRVRRGTAVHFLVAVVQFGAFVAWRGGDRKAPLNDIWVSEYLGQLEDSARTIMRAKNHDYAGGKEVAQPFANFTRTESLGITTTEQGFLVRLSDKLSRLATFTSGNQLKVKDESVRDTIADSFNYGILCLAHATDKESRGGYVQPETKK